MSKMFWSISESFLKLLVNYSAIHFNSFVRWKQGATLKKKHTPDLKLKSLGPLQYKEYAPIVTKQKS